MHIGSNNCSCLEVWFFGGRGMTEVVACPFNPENNQLESVNLHAIGVELSKLVCP